MKLIIAGSRDLGEVALVEAAMVRFKLDPTYVISGCARGPDTAGIEWAADNNIPVITMPADWQHKGRGAGYIRNSQMAKRGDALLAIWDGESRGTHHMITEMQKLEKPVYLMKVTFTGENNEC